MILGSQARRSWAIVGWGGNTGQTQDVFRKIVDDTIIQSDDTVTISNMRRAIQDTNVILNLAVSPGIILVPSSLIILERPIPGFNNVLTTSTDSMQFGVNKAVNYIGVKKDPPKKVHQPDAPTPHSHDDLDKETPETNSHKQVKIDEQKVSKPVNLDNHNTELVTLLGLSSGLTYVVMRYVL